MSTLMLNFDPRMKLAVVIIFITTAYLLPTTYALLYLFLLISALYLSAKLYMGAIKVIAVFALFETLKLMLIFITNSSFSIPISYMLFFLERTSVAFFMVAWMSNKINISRLISSLQAMRLPTSIVVALAVIFRFSPTVKSEFIAIKNTMKLRGVGINIKNILLHPIKTVEYAFIPLFIRSIKIADEISVSAMTRGLGLNKKRSCHDPVKLKASDYLTALIIFTLLMPSFFIFDSI